MLASRGFSGRLPRESIWKVFVSPLSRISESFRRDIGQILTWKMFFIIKNIFIMKNLTARKTVEAGVDPRLCSTYLEDNWIKP